MKTFFSALAVLFTVSTFSFSQLNEGSIHLAGSSDFSFLSVNQKVEFDGEDTDNATKTSELKLKPSIGYFVVDNFALGLSIDYARSKEDKDISTNYLIGPYAIYYFGNSNVRPFLRGDFGYGQVIQNYDGEKQKAKAFGYDLGGGVAVFLGNHVSLDFGIAYFNSTTTYDELQLNYYSEGSEVKLITDGFGVTGGISVYL
ncbi:outer membrane beta-barrel protein [Labilibacter marinus]|uniref:outer membrane beta-barrel protein n=1 Tax=Labilibacter marinus TaxID=1477105 RepID=UPI00094F5FA1|nr:outer membrane beta-barrel protein [Labilibacter marinus]